MDKLEILCFKSDEILQNAYCCSTGTNYNDSELLKTKLRFPYKRASKTEGDGHFEKREIRVSEQESRFAFVEAIMQDDDLQYCVETPTTKTYKFQNKSKQNICDFCVCQILRVGKKKANPNKSRHQKSINTL